MFVSGETCKPRERGRESEKRLEAGGDRNKGWLEDSLDPITGALSLMVKMYTQDMPIVGKKMCAGKMDPLNFMDITRATETETIGEKKPSIPKNMTDT